MNDLEDAEINLTPLIDVVFVILIMFIVIAPLLEKEEISLAQAPDISTELAHAVESQSLITLHVKADKTIWLNQQRVSIDELDKGLAVCYRAYPGCHPQLFQDEEAPFGLYQQVKNAVAKAGFETLDVILKP
jgi:biopolymer transport protein ExbD